MENMYNWIDAEEPLCMTSERGEVFFSKDETSHNKTTIAHRILGAFDYKSSAEITFILKTNRTAVKTLIEGTEFPTTEILLGIHTVTGVSIHWLLTGQGPKHPISKTNQLY